MDCCLALVVPCILPGLSNVCGNILSCLSEKVDNMVNLKENLESLSSALNELKAKRDDVEKTVKVRRLMGGEQSAEEANWLFEVHTFETNTNQLIAKASDLDTSSQDASSGHQLASTSGCSSPDNISIGSIGDEVSNKLNEVRDLFLRGKFEDKIVGALPPVVEKRDVDQTFGLDTMLEKTWESLMKNTKLGIHGTEGVGKTTLLTLINNKFDDVKDDFDIVIWVQVTKDVNIEKIQDTIAERLHIRNEKWSTYSKTDKAAKIGRVLTDVNPRFVLLLDDLWEEVKFSEIGISFLGKQYKVVFTTRSKKVCGRMKADEDIEIGCLAEKDALDLLKTIARCSTLNGKMLDQAKYIVKKCGGLPFAIEAIGKCLSSRTTEDEWNTVLDPLASCPDDSEQADQKVIESIFKKAKTLLDNIPMQRNANSSMFITQNQTKQPEAILNTQPKTVQIRQPDVNRKDVTLNVRELKISSKDNARCWTFLSLSESPNEAAIEVAKMGNHNYYLEVSGKLDTDELTFGTRYEVVFVVKVEDTMSRWNYPAKVQLMVPEKDLQERELQFVDLIKNQWVEIRAGVFDAQPHKEKIAFYLYQYESKDLMTGLQVRGVIIRPTENADRRKQPETILNTQPKTVQIRQPDVNSKGATFNVRQLKISSSYNARYWTFVSLSESPNEAAIEVAKMGNHNYYLEVSGKLDTNKLAFGTRYEVVFVVKVEDTISRWDNPAKVQLMVPEKDLQERELQFVDLIKNQWVEIRAGVFDARPHKEKIAFYLYNRNSKHLMIGLQVKGAIIRPMY